MPLPLLHPRLTLELNIGLEIPLKIGLPLTGLPNTEGLLLPLQVASKVPVLVLMVHLVVLLHTVHPLVLLDLHNIQLAVALQFRWLPSEVLLHQLLIPFSLLKLLKLRPITLPDNRLWN